MVSVIIPNYNNEKYLKKCLESVINQTYTNLEIIIIDDGSTDNSENIINEIIKNNQLFKIVFLKQNNLNAAVARNRGLEIALGKYIYFLDSDDFISSNDVLKKMVNDIENNDLLIGNHTVIDENGNFVKKAKIVNDGIIDVNNCYRYAMISPGPSNKLYRKEIIDKNKVFFSNVRIGQDLNFYLKYLAFCNKIKIVNYSTYNYRIVNTGISKSIGYNVFDIVKGFEEVEKMYLKYEKKDDYDKYIALLQLKHYNFQMSKYYLSKSKYFRKSLLLFYKNYYLQINKTKIADKEKLKSIDKEIKRKLFWYPLITTNLFCYLKNNSKYYKKLLSLKK